MAFSEGKVMIISRSDGNRGPLGVAKAVNRHLALKPGCEVIEVTSGGQLLRELISVALNVKGYSVCIHANGYRVPLALYLVSRLNRRNRYFCVVHGIVNVEKEYRPVSRKDTVLEPFVFRRFDSIVCVSDFERDRLFDLYGRRDNVTVIHNGVDDSWLRARASREAPSCAFHTLLTGGYEKRKGADVALALCEKVAARGIDASMIVCGRDGAEVGSIRPQCEEAAAKAGVELEYLGEIADKAALREIHRRADFCFSLSRFDTFNCSVLEGMAMGCIPIVSTDCGAAELLDENCALVVDLHNPGDLERASEKVASILANPALMRHMSLSAASVAAGHGWDTVAEEYWRLLANA